MCELGDQDVLSEPDDDLVQVQLKCAKLVLRIRRCVGSIRRAPYESDMLGTAVRGALGIGVHSSVQLDGLCQVSQELSHACHGSYSLCGVRGPTVPEAISALAQRLSVMVYSEVAATLQQEKCKPVMSSGGDLLKGLYEGRHRVPESTASTIVDTIIQTVSFVHLGEIHNALADLEGHVRIARRALAKARKGFEVVDEIDALKPRATNNGIGGQKEETEEAQTSPGLKPSQAKAFAAFNYAEEHAERELKDKEAYAILKELDIPELPDYTLPAYGTWRRYLSTARRALGCLKSTRRAAREGRSVVRPDQI